MENQRIAEGIKIQAETYFVRQCSSKPFAPFRVTGFDNNSNHQERRRLAEKVLFSRHQLQTLPLLLETIDKMVSSNGVENDKFGWLENRAVSSSLMKPYSVWELKIVVLEYGGLLDSHKIHLIQ
ncbi:hypothetical protein NPIL_658021 [Nephila pilipes]|uniref:Uncharacterized protein n=1 Tax=Nephila pilipes TaxID=299642 RepID=A0A8X6QD17_NEPPI|nr:hypothetical protein NPIL_658021 [Nephila pilipes]